MLIRNALISSVALILLTISSHAGTIVYVVAGGSQQEFGTLNLSTGTFNQIGPNLSEFVFGLVPGPDGSLLTLGVDGILESINPGTGVAAVVGPTGLNDCSSPGSSPCGLNSANTLGASGGAVYATDFANNLYSVNPLTGATTKIGSTGIPAVTFVPDLPLPAPNPDGIFGAFDETLFSAGGNLYATFDTITVDPTTNFSVTPVISNELYRINTSTGLATPVGPTTLTLGATASVNGTTYSFDNQDSQVVTLNTANGQTSIVSDFDPNAGLVTGASPTPEPASLTLAAIGTIAILVWRRRVKMPRLFRVGSAAGLNH